MSVKIIINNKVNWDNLSGNPGAIQILETYPDKINWNILSGNPSAEHLLKQNPDKINWKWLSTNPAPWALKILSQNPYNISLYWVCFNPAIDILFEKYIGNRVWYIGEWVETDAQWNALSANPGAYRILCQNKSRINMLGLSKNSLFSVLYDNTYITKKMWKYLSANPDCIQFLLDNPNKINHKTLSENTNPDALKLIDEKEIDWEWLSANPSAIDILSKRKHRHKICFEWLCSNHNAGELLNKKYRHSKKEIDIDKICLNPNPDILHLYCTSLVYVPSTVNNHEMEAEIEDNTPILLSNKFEQCGSFIFIIIIYIIALMLSVEST
jgi:hypothetical protein